MNPVMGSFQWTLDRMVAIGYGVVYDYIFEQFAPYQNLKTEVLKLVEAAVPPGTSHRDVQILDIACGPGNMAVTLAEAGFSVVGMDPYGALIELAREKRRAKSLANVAFRHADLATDTAFKSGLFDHVVNIHSLYLHPSPERLLHEACRVLKPGGLAIIVHRTRPVARWSTVRDLHHRDGFRTAARSLLWLVPNSIFEAGRKQVGSYYWDEDEFVAALRDAGFHAARDAPDVPQRLEPDRRGAERRRGVEAPRGRGVTTVNGADATSDGGSTIMIGPMRRGLRAGMDHVTSVGYGVIYDYIFERFAPYQDVKHQVLEFVGSGVAAGARRRDVHVLDVGCGPGNFSLMLAEAGFSVTGLDTYDALVDLAQEKRRAKRPRGGLGKRSDVQWRAQRRPAPPAPFTDRSRRPRHGVVTGRVGVGRDLAHSPTYRAASYARA